MLAGETFSDHPEVVCPVIAGFLRSYNDRLPPAELDRLYPIAALVVGSASTWRVRRRRTRRLWEWARAADCAGSAHRLSRGEARHRIVVAAAQAAVDLGPERRHPAVWELMNELVAMTAGGVAALPLAAPAIEPARGYDEAIGP